MISTLKNPNLLSSFAVIFLILFVWSDNLQVNSAVIETLHLPNLDSRCMKCLCHAATGCNLTLGCISGYCGPMKVSRVYWIDAEKVVLPEDDPERSGAFEDCSFSFTCVQRMVRGYLGKYGRDCNGDGVTDCDDYSMINFNGGYSCQTPLGGNNASRMWKERYENCMGLN